MNIEILFIMLDAILVISIVTLIMVVLIFASSKKARNEYSSAKDYEKKVYSAKFKAISRKEVEDLDGEGLSYDINDDDKGGFA